MTPKLQKAAHPYDDEMPAYDVMVDGVKVGTVYAEEHTERRNFSGKRYGYDLRPRKIWRTSTSERVWSRVKFDTRKSAVDALVQAVAR